MRDQSPRVFLQADSIDFGGESLGTNEFISTVIEFAHSELEEDFQRKTPSKQAIAKFMESYSPAQEGEAYVIAPEVVQRIRDCHNAYVMYCKSNHYEKPSVAKSIEAAVAVQQSGELALMTADEYADMSQFEKLIERLKTDEPIPVSGAKAPVAEVKVEAVPETNLPSATPLNAQGQRVARLEDFPKVDVSRLPVTRAELQSYITEYHLTDVNVGDLIELHKRGIESRAVLALLDEGHQFETVQQAGEVLTHLTSNKGRLSIPQLMQFTKLTDEQKIKLAYGRAALDIDTYIEFAEYFGLEAVKSFNERNEDGQLVPDLDNIVEVAEKIVNAYAAGSAVVQEELNRPEATINANIALEKFMEIAKANESLIGRDFDRALELVEEGQHALDSHTEDFDDESLD